MPSRRKGNMDIRAILHQIQQGATDRQIATSAMVPTC